MAEAFLGEIRLFGFNFAPVGWAMCQGQLLSIQQYSALFALLGTYYGGNGTTNFALPDLRGRVPIGVGQGPGLTPYVQGQQGGSETVTLSVNQMPAHSHAVNAEASTANSDKPTGAIPGKAGTPSYSTSAPTTTMNAAMIGPTGGSQPFGIEPPYLALNWCIALQGIFPSRN